MRDFGGMCRFARAGGEAAARAWPAPPLFTLGESLGGVESLVGHPGLMTHAAVVAAAEAVRPVRLSVGIEDAADLLADLEQALDGQ